MRPLLANAPFYLLNIMEILSPNSCLGQNTPLRWGRPIFRKQNRRAPDFPARGHARRRQRPMPNQGAKSTTRRAQAARRRERRVYQPVCVSDTLHTHGLRPVHRFRCVALLVRSLGATRLVAPCAASRTFVRLPLHSNRTPRSLVLVVEVGKLGELVGELGKQQMGWLGSWGRDHGPMGPLAGGVGKLGGDYAQTTPGSI